MDRETTFARIRSALEKFKADIVRARADQAATEQTIASAEYELEQLKMLLAENVLAAEPAALAVPVPSSVEILSEDVGRGPGDGLVDRAA